MAVVYRPGPAGAAPGAEATADAAGEESAKADKKDDGTVIDAEVVEEKKG